MSKESLNQAMDNIEVAYKDLIEIANSSLSEFSSDIDNLIDEVYFNIENLDNDRIRDILLKLSLRAYSFSDFKDKSQFKADLAETLRKEAYAKNFNTLDGSVAVKDNIATLNISSEIVVEHLYNLTAALFKTKLD